MHILQRVRLQIHLFSTEIFPCSDCYSINMAQNPHEIAQLVQTLEASKATGRPKGMKNFSCKKTTFDVEGTPTFIMFLDGQEAGRAAGPRPTVSSVLRVVSQPFEG